MGSSYQPVTGKPAAGPAALQPVGGREPGRDAEGSLIDDLLVEVDSGSTRSWSGAGRGTGDFRLSSATSGAGAWYECEFSSESPPDDDTSTD